MFNRSLLLAALSVAAASASAQLPTRLEKAFASAAPTQVANQVLVKIKPGQEANATATYKKLGITVLRSIPRIGWTVIKVPTSMTVATAKTKLASVATNVSPNYVERAFDTTPNDPLYSQQYSHPIMRVPAAWDLSMGSKDVIVAVIDSGVDYNHPDLANKVRKDLGYDFVQNDADAMDVQGHGTHVSGIVGAEANNSVGVAGVGANTMIMPVRVLGDDGTGPSDGVAQGIVWAADHGAQIINMSLGNYVGIAPAQQDAIDYATSKNVLVIVSAGNAGDEGNPKGWPAAYPVCVAVGASDRYDQRGSFSEYNDNPNDPWVDIAAPGVDVLSTIHTPTQGYENASGTSMAAPNAAGVASLIYARYLASGVTPTSTQVRTALENGCDSIGTWIAKGRVNAFNSLRMIGTRIDEATYAKSAAAVDGTMTGTEGAMDLASDDLVGTVNALNRPGVGFTGSMEATFTPSDLQTSEISGATVSLRLSSDSMATIQVYATDGSTALVTDAQGKPILLNGQRQYKTNWTLLKSVAGSSSMKSYSIALTSANMAKFMGHTGTATDSRSLRFMVRSLVPTRYVRTSSGVTTIDQMGVSYTGYRVEQE